MSNDKKDEPKPKHKSGPSAGPHAKPELTDTDKTPGSGMLPPNSTNSDDENMQPSS